MAEKKPIDFKYNMKIFWGFLSKYKKSFIFILIFIFFLQGFKVIESYLFKILIDEGSLFAAGQAPLFINTLFALLFAFGAIVILRPTTRWIQHSLLNTMESSMIYDLKVKFYNHLIHLSHKFHTTHKTGSLIARLLRGGHAIEGLTDVFVFNFAPLAFQLIIAGGALFAVHWVSAVTMLGVIVVFTAFSLYLQSKQKKINMEVINKEDFEKANVADSFTNIDSIKYFGRENAMKKKYSKIARDTTTTMRLHWNYYRALGSGQDVILGIGILLLVLAPIRGILAGTVTVGELVFIYSVFGGIAHPLFAFIHGIRNYYRAMADFESLFQYLKISNDIKDRPGAKQMKVRKGTIEFRNVTFGYQKKPLLRNFNLKINKNEKIALVGLSGSGKSTIVKLLYRLFDVNRGEVLVDGMNVRDVKQESLRGEFSIVPQECVLFDDTIYNNIRFVRPNATNKEVDQALKFAQLDKVIAGFPEKGQTIVGERGVKLSGGEKQRVSIARAILANKKILVLDEATSALDSQTEHEIQKAMDELMEGRTSIIIAHRLSTIMRADRIIVLHRGKIIQEGTHKALIKKKGPYKKLWDLQKGGYV